MYALVHEWEEVVERGGGDGALADLEVDQGVVVHVVHAHLVRDREPALKPGHWQLYIVIGILLKIIATRNDYLVPRIYRFILGV